MVTMKFKLLFFDSPRVQRAVDAATRGALSRAGAFIRRTAKTSIRKSKKISQPGKPPRSHEGSLRRLIFFGYDPASETMVIGPAKFRQGGVPNLLEFGGVTTQEMRSGARQRVVYRKRPFMGPALEAEIPRLPSRWRNSVRGG